MSAVRAVANAESWSLTTGLKGYFSCCFSKKEASAPASVSGDTKADASERVPDSPPCRRSSSASKSNDDGTGRDGAAAMVDRRLEADGASYHSTGTDRASRSVAGDQLSGDVMSSHDTGASRD